MIRLLQSLILSFLFVWGSLAAEQQTQVWKDGTRYIGEVVNGKREGEGTIIWPDGTRYIGTFHEDKRHGPGTMMLPNGTVLKGTFRNDTLEAVDPKAVEPPEGTSRQPVELPPVTALSTVVEAELKAALGEWADAWTRQDPAGYLALYAPDFAVPDQLSRRQWEILRRSRIKKPSRIKVSLDFQDFELLAPNLVQVRVQQHYSSNLFSDQTAKRFRLKRDSRGEWKIVEELVLP